MHPTGALKLDGKDNTSNNSTSIVLEDVPRMLIVTRKRGTAGKSDSERGSVGTGSAGRGRYLAGHHVRVRYLVIPPKKRVSLPSFSQLTDGRMVLDPYFKEVVSGPVTMVTLEGNLAAQS